MKLPLFLYFILIVFLPCAFKAGAQDTLKLKTGKMVICKVHKIGSEEIEYRRWDNPDGPLYAIDKNNVFYVRFANGLAEAFDDNESNFNKEQKIMYKKSSVKVSVFSFVSNKFTLGFERCIKTGWNIEAYASLISNNMLNNGYTDNLYTKSQGFACVLGNKFLLGNDYYIKGARYAHPLKGRFLRIDVSYNRFALMNVYLYNPEINHTWHSSTDLGNLNVNLYGLGISYGRQYLLGKSFSLQYNVGLNYAIVTTGFVVNQANVTVPNYRTTYVKSESDPVYDSFISMPNIIKIHDVPLGVSANLTIGYLPGKKKKS